MSEHTPKGPGHHHGGRGLAVGEEDLPAQYCTGMKVVATPSAKNVNPMVIKIIIATQNRIAIIIMSGRFTFPPQVECCK